ncbi:hypothetical protein KP509_33G033300 [Ceratopteris richardii]|nr:hypothetical protein KP509_33G033300 [Ceratopteris richardii]
MTLPFLGAFLVLLVVAGMSQTAIARNIEVSQLTISYPAMHEMAIASKTFISPLFSSWIAYVSPSNIKASSSTEEKNDADNWKSSLLSLVSGSRSYSGWLSALRSVTSASYSSTQALHDEGKETLACPTSCFRPNPVCGVDGITYWCGTADAKCADVEVEYEGFCDFDSRGTGVTGILAIQSLFLVHMVWLMLAAFLVFLGVI